VDEKSEYYLLENSFLLIVELVHVHLVKATKCDEARFPTLEDSFSITFPVSNY
jgi:hypothetical protein